jgi:integrase
MHPWTAGELASFLGWSTEHAGHHVAYRLLAMTGARRGEILALRWRDLDAEPAPGPARGFYIQRLLSDEEGACLHPERFSRTFQADLKRARKVLPDLPAARLHDLRHTHATILLDRPAVRSRWCQPGWVTRARS